MRTDKSAPAKKRTEKMIAKVDETKCTGCGICLDVCPEEAITVDQVAKIDAADCIGCGSCVDECPTGVISLEETEAASFPRASNFPSPPPITSTRDKPPANPSWISGGQNGYKRPNGGLLSQIFNLFGSSAGQGRGLGKGQGQGRGKGRGDRGRCGKGRRNP